ncbi:hypothetical protein GCM10022377_17870 [Zhihengliuella alba]|uniref:Mandelate racemase/muconate lactonizing enzyme C-terminal domain-containing protein n=1 Tax=Zhihengliuella alba TaxID=547018 RepID=A0ABP7DER1_9MICC
MNAASPAEPGAAPAIERIDLRLLSMPFSAGRREDGAASAETVDSFNASSRTFTAMQSLVVSVTTADGLVGWGEAFGHRTNPATWAALEDIVGPFFLGQPADAADLRPRAEHAFHAFGRTGPVHYALSAVDTALWDLAAQRAGLPLRRLLDAGARDSIGAYASLVHYGEDPDEVARQILRARAAGFGAFKLHESTVPAVAAARGAAGDAPLMVDVNCRWDEAAADAALADLAGLDLCWLEEPVFPPDDRDALARLNARHGIVSAGENASGTCGLIGDMAAGAVTVAQPSVGKLGGISAMMEVYRAGERLGVPVVPHCFYYGPALLATAQLIAALPVQRTGGRPGMDGSGRALPELEVPFLDWPERLHPLHGHHQQQDHQRDGRDRPHGHVRADETAERGVLGHNGSVPIEPGPAGTVVLPGAPGLGFAPDPEVMDRHTVQHATISREGHP